jgi:hypothetical protein
VSALYLFLVVGVWVSLTLLLWRIWRRWRVREGGNPRVRGTVALVIAVLWFGASFWYAGGQTIYYDMEVNRLCKQDGGVKVYEQVKLPPNEYEQYAKTNWILPGEARVTAEHEYHVESDIQYLKRGNPSIWRSHHRLIRRSDRKLLGESIMYARSGGDLPGPWHPSSFKCPEPTERPSLAISVFTKAEKK